MLVPPQFFSLRFIYFHFIYLQLHWVFVAARGPSAVAASGGSSLVMVLGLLTAVGFSSSGTRV